MAELSANAVRHGRVPGRDFRLRLSAEGATLRAYKRSWMLGFIRTVPPGSATPNARPRGH